MGVAHSIQQLLCSLKICDKDSIGPFYPKVRDRADVAVLRCRKSGVIFLSRCDHIGMSHYEGQEALKYWGPGDRKIALETTQSDDKRRADQFRGIIAGKVWLDVGTGLGGILDLLSSSAQKILAVEPQEAARECLQGLGYQVYRDLNDVPQEGIEVATLFHVFEHLTEPLVALGKIRELMAPGGKIIIEVPLCL